ncbi:hypothetical protein BU25DRAFT_113921 [Macroventuria anomochaeta]|uniref:Uncharacterized protein n=1 Tax=Macroventuria anomochaeta TaxID=301207 RepID=A0ACB6RWG2_9PLEO|nr:uncharacterized protein BU25DRAFT_113921 [Macroventuria anomochaeta]KAF2625478.1 hypothetical protein BU25DRAFT_113921 [Macroventuria anomochaeta]
MRGTAAEWVWERVSRGETAARSTFPSPERLGVIGVVATQPAHHASTTTVHTFRCTGYVLHGSATRLDDTRHVSATCTSTRSEPFTNSRAGTLCSPSSPKTQIWGICLASKKIVPSATQKWILTIICLCTLRGSAKDFVSAMQGSQGLRVASGQLALV